MTIYQLHLKLVEKCDELFQEVSPDLTLETQDSFLNEAVIEYLDTYLALLDDNAKGFESSETMTNELSNLVKQLVINNTAYTPAVIDARYSVKRYDYPSDYFRTVVVRLNTNTAYKGKTQHKAFTKTHNELNIVLEDPFAEDVFRVSKADSTTEARYVELYHKSIMTATTLLLTYLKKPIEFKEGVNYITTAGVLDWNTVNVWLSDATVRKVIEIAANNIKKTIK